VGSISSWSCAASYRLYGKEVCRLLQRLRQIGAHGRRVWIADTDFTLSKCTAADTVKSQKRYKVVVAS